MSPRLVVCFRWQEPGVPPDHYLAAAERVWRRCSQVGGRAISWSAQAYGFEFAPETFRLVLRTVLDLLNEASTHSVGISPRPLGVDEAARYWGQGLVVAEALAAEASAGEILLDPLLEPVREGLLETSGSVSLRLVRERLDAALLVPETCSPDGFRAAEGAAQGSVPGGRPAASLSASGRPSRRSRSATVRGPTRAKLSSKAPPKPKSVPPGQKATSRGGPVADEPSDGATARRAVAPYGQRSSVLAALRSRNPQQLRHEAHELSRSGQKPTLAQRLEALAMLADGHPEEGLGLLAEAAAEAREQLSAEACQATLAYAVGLAQVGHQHQALFEALRGLAAARRSADVKGEHACAQLIALLADSAGYSDVAERWQQASQR